MHLTMRLKAMRKPRVPVLPEQVQVSELKAGRRLELFPLPELQPERSPEERLHVNLQWEGSLLSTEVPYAA